MQRVANLAGVVTINQLAAAGKPEAASKLMFLQWLRTAAPDTYNAAMKIALARNGVAPVSQLSGAMQRTLGEIYSSRTFAERQSKGLGSMGSDYASYASAVSNYTNDQISALSQTPVNLSDVPVPTLNTDGTVSTTTSTTSSPSSISSSSTQSTSSSPGISASSLTSALTTLTSVAGAVAKIVNPTASNIVAVNAQRAAAGLPPLNPDGSVMTPAQLAAAGYTSAQITSMEAALAASGSTTTTILGLPWYLWALGGAALLFVLSKRS